MKISDSSLTNLFWVFSACVRVCVCVCVCVCVYVCVYVLFTYTIYISIICASQEETSLIAINQQLIWQTTSQYSLKRKDIMETLWYQIRVPVKKYMLNLSKPDALLHKTHIKVLLIPSSQGLTCVDQCYRFVK